MLSVEKLPDKETIMSDKDYTGEHLEREGQRNGQGPLLAVAGAGAGGATKKQKLVRHFKRWWWVHLLVFVCIVVLVVCLM